MCLSSTPGHARRYVEVFFFFFLFCSECERRRYWSGRSWSQRPISAWIEANGLSWWAKAEHGLEFSAFGVCSAGSVSVLAGNKWAAPEAEAVFLYLRAYFLESTALLRAAGAFLNSWHSSLLCCHGCFLCSSDSSIGFEILICVCVCVCSPPCLLYRKHPQTTTHAAVFSQTGMAYSSPLLQRRCGFLQRHEAPLTQTCIFSLFKKMSKKCCLTQSQFFPHLLCSTATCFLSRCLSNFLCPSLLHPFVSWEVTVGRAEVSVRGLFHGVCHPPLLRKRQSLESERWWNRGNSASRQRLKSGSVIHGKAAFQFPAGDVGLSERI